jgi:hypothetical protein
LGNRVKPQNYAVVKVENQVQIEAQQNTHDYDEKESSGQNVGGF